MCTQSHPAWHVSILSHCIHTQAGLSEAFLASSLHGHLRLQENQTGHFQSSLTYVGHDLESKACTCGVPSDGVLPSDGDKRPTAVSNSFMVCGDSRASLGSNSQRGGPPLQGTEVCHSATLWALVVSFAISMNAASEVRSRWKKHCSWLSSQWLSKSAGRTRVSIKSSLVQTRPRGWAGPGNSSNHHPTVKSRVMKITSAKHSESLCHLFSAVQARPRSTP